MTKKQLRQRMEDMCLGAWKGYGIDFSENGGGIYGQMDPESFFGWVQAVLTEFVPDKSHLWKPRHLYVFDNMTEAVNAVWDAMTG